MSAGKRRGHRACPGPPTPSRHPAHLGGAADAARRVGAGLGAHAQRARPVEAQAALAGRQEGGQVLVARERLRVAAAGTGTGSERAPRAGPEPSLPRLLTWPTAETLRTRTAPGSGPSATRNDASRGKSTSS